MIYDSDELTGSRREGNPRGTEGRLLMDFNPLMLLAGNLTSIIQDGGEEGRRKRQKGEGRKGEEAWRRGSRKGGSKDAFPSLSVSRGTMLPSPPSAPFSFIPAREADASTR